MLPIYKAIQKVSSLEGGATRPWKVLVLEDGKPVAYVVKFFNRKDIEEAHHVAREVFGSAMADEMGLSRPTPAFIEFDEAFLQTLNSEDRSFIAAKDSRLKFGCKFIEGSAPFTTRTPRYVLDRFEAENIYAFDNLIFNVDRRIGKPNILLHDEGYYLIDHELTFQINLRTILNFEQERSIYNYRIHIFHKYLKRAKRETRNNFFDSFEEILRYSRPRETLTPFRDQLVQLEHPVGEFEVLMQFLELTKRKSSVFTGMLRNQIS